MPVTLQLIRNEPDLRLVAALERLLQMAKAGDLAVLAYVALQCGTGYSADTLGPMADNRLLALGVCHDLVALVSK